MNEQSERAALESEIDARLRRDSASWGDEPSADGAARLRAALSHRARPYRGMRTIIAAAAAIIVSVAVWLWLEPVAQEPGRRAGVEWAVDLFEPLQREFDAVSEDASSIARTLLAPVCKMGRSVGYVTSRLDPIRSDPRRSDPRRSDH